MASKQISCTNKSLKCFCCFFVGQYDSDLRELNYWSNKADVEYILPWLEKKDILYVDYMMVLHIHVPRVTTSLL